MKTEAKIAVRFKLIEAAQMMRLAADKIREVKNCHGSDLGLNEHAELEKLATLVCIQGVRIRDWEPIEDRPTSKTKDRGERIVRVPQMVPENV